MELKHLLGYLSILVFCFLFFISEDRRRTYLLFVLYCFPLIDINVTPEDYGYFSVFDFVSYVCLIFLGKEIVVDKRLDFYYINFILLIVIVIIGSLQSYFIIISLVNVFKLISVFIFCLYLLSECKSNPDFVVSIIKALKVNVLIAVGFLTVQLIIGIGFTFYYDLNQNVYDSNIIRYPSYFQDPQIFAQFMAMSSFAFLIKIKESSRTKVYNYLLFILVVFVLFLSGGRSGFLGLSCGFLLIFLFGPIKWRLSALIISVLIVVVMLAFPGSFSILNRQETALEAYQVRNSIWKESLNVLNLHPYLGIGWGNYLSYTKLFSLDGYYIINDEIVYYGTENGYLKLLVELGIAGFILSMIFIFIPLSKGFYFYFRNKNKISVLFIISSIVTWLVSFVTIFSLSDKRIFILLATFFCLLIFFTKKPLLSDVFKEYDAR